MPAPVHPWGAVSCYTQGLPGLRVACSLGQAVVVGALPPFLTSPTTTSALLSPGWAARGPHHLVTCAMRRRVYVASGRGTASLSLCQAELGLPAGVWVGSEQCSAPRVQAGPRGGTGGSPPVAPPARPVMPGVDQAKGLGSGQKGLWVSLCPRLGRNVPGGWPRALLGCFSWSDTWSPQHMSGLTPAQGVPGNSRSREPAGLGDSAGALPSCAQTFFF